MKLLKWIKSLFTVKPFNYQQWHVEAFVESKNPKSNAEVEYWVRKFEQEYSPRGFMR
jgi:hypothetical protein